MPTVTANSHGQDRRQLLWDVVEEHLDEAEFLLGQWLRAARSPLFSLAQLRRTLEDRLVAHLDALVVGGHLVADELLWPACTGEDAPASMVAAAASALLCDPGADAAHRLVALFGSARAPVRSGLRTAFQLVARVDMDEPLRSALYAMDDPAAQTDLLETLAARRVDPGPILGTLLRAGDSPALLAAALHAAAIAAPGSLRHLVEDRLHHGDAGVRAAAMRTGMIWNLAAAWSECLAGVRAGSGQAMLLAALAGDKNTVALLTPALSNESQRGGALFALGFTGFPTAVEACLVHLDDPDETCARLAVEAIAGITDLPWTDTAFLRAPAAAAEEAVDADLPPLEADLETDLEPGPTAELPLPAGASVRTWWEQNRQRFEPHRRYVQGAPMTAASVAAALKEGTLRRSGPLACEVAIRSGGRLQLPALRLDHQTAEIPADISFTREPGWR